MQKLYPLLLIINLLVTISIARSVPPSFCAKFQSKEPFLSHMILCKSQKPYFRTSLGLFPISSIDYTTKTLTISHPSSSSSSRQYISPWHLSAGFPSSPRINSVLLFNCSNNIHHIRASISNCTRLHVQGATSEIQELKVNQSCLLVDDLEKLGTDFHPKDLNCSRYRRVYRRSLDESKQEVGLGTRISFDIPDHVPDVCKECEKPNGNCGVGLKCICHPKECNKVISLSGSMNPAGNILFSLLSFTVFMVSWIEY